MASEADFYIKEGDTSPNIRAQLLDDDGSPAQVTQSSQVKFKMKPVGGQSFKIDDTGTITDVDNAYVRYAWVGSDTDTAGYYNAVFEVDYNGDGNYDETFPNSQYIVVRIDEAL
jgi:hypothetical protein